MQLAVDSHNRAIIGVVVGQRSTHVVVTHAAEVSMPPVPGTTTVRTERHSVGARRITHSPPKAVAVGVGALHLVTAVKSNASARCAC